MNLLTSLLKNKIILEIGCNTGKITTQIAKYNPKRIIAIDNDLKHLNIANKIETTFEKNKVKFLKINFLKKRDLKKVKIKFDVIIIRHIFACFSYETNKKIIFDLEKKLKKNGAFLIIDFYKKIIFRHLFFSIIRLNITSGIKRFINSLKKDSFILDKKKINKYFNENYNTKIFNKDFFNKHESKLIKIINFLFNCSYTMIVKKNDN
jgi:2-polyprenyl-3-methyl-5-hydroxy-6-metoxy-1,4-benzoquinol methylase